MTNLTETSTWEAGIYQLEQTDPVLGGPPDLANQQGFDNVQPQQLANRTRWLRDQLEALQTALANIDVSAQINMAINDLIDGAPGALDTLNELAAAITSNDSEITGLVTTIGSKLTAANNLSDVTDAAAARANIGAGTGVPTGTIAAFHGTAAPAGWLICDGSPVTSTYPQLRAHLLAQPGVTTDGSGDPLLPDYRGEFLRGLDSGRGVDAGRILGSAQDDQVTVPVEGYGTTGAKLGTAPVGRMLVGSGILEGSENLESIRAAGADQTVNGAASETRPRNVAALICIKAADMTVAGGAISVDIATSEQARAGVSNNALMTPWRTREAVGSMYAAVAHDAKGSVGFFRFAGGSINPGDVTAGSALHWASYRSGDGDFGSSVPGSWMALSFHDDATNRLGVFKRVA